MRIPRSLFYVKQKRRWRRPNRNLHSRNDTWTSNVCRDERQKWSWWARICRSAQIIWLSKNRYLVISDRPIALFAWPIIALIIGVFPITVGYAIGSTFHQILMGLLLMPLFWLCVFHDRLTTAIFFVVVTVASHSAVVIMLSACDPTGASKALSGSQPYWEETLQWLTTGDSYRYQTANWLPEHLRLYCTVCVSSFLTLGVFPFLIGIEQVDLMNFYVGRLAAQSDGIFNPLAFGWHPWSLQRGLSYIILVFVTTSWALQRVTKQEITRPTRHVMRLAISMVLAFADVLTKMWLAPVIRHILYVGLLPGAK